MMRSMTTARLLGLVLACGLSFMTQRAQAGACLPMACKCDSDCPGLLCSSDPSFSPGRCCGKPVTMGTPCAGSGAGGAAGGMGAMGGMIAAGSSGAGSGGSNSGGSTSAGSSGAGTGSAGTSGAAATGAGAVAPPVMDGAAKKDDGCSVSRVRHTGGRGWALAVLGALAATAIGRRSSARRRNLRSYR